jgi:probable HAF family extracellular repeat protein
MTKLLRRAAAAALIVASGAAFAARERGYAITEIAPPGLTWIEVTAVNNRGDVAGFYRAPHAGVTFEVEQAFLWRNGTVTGLGFPTPILNSRIWGMNDKGVLVGGVYGGNAYAWQDGTWIDLGFGGEARSINKSGAIAGISSNFGFNRGFLYANGVLWDIGNPDTRLASFAYSVNDRNQVVGTAEVNAIGERHAYVWGAGALTDVGTLGGPTSVLSSINSHGYAVGWSFDRDFGIAAAQWKGDLARLFDLPGTHLATAVNDRGAVVGTIDSGAFLYDDGVLTRLDQLPAVVNSGWTELIPSAINDRGWIVGRGLRNGQRRGFVLNPA